VRKLALAVLVALPLVVAQSTEAHVGHKIGPNQCQRNWKSVEGNRSQIICIGRLWGADVDHALKIAGCESGYRWNAVSPSRTYRGTWQMGPMFEGNRDHMLPGLPNASPFGGRHATIFFYRYAEHFGTSAWACA
jgi:hypothetical protein